MPTRRELLWLNAGAWAPPVAAVVLTLLQRRRHARRVAATS